MSSTPRHLSPQDPSIGICCWIRGRSCFFAKQHAAAAASLLKSVQGQNLWYSGAYLASAHALLGNA